MWEKKDNNGLLKSDGDKSCGKRKGLPEVEICQKGRLIKMTSFEGRIKGAEGLSSLSMYFPQGLQWAESSQEVNPNSIPGHFQTMPGIAQHKD